MNDTNKLSKLKTVIIVAIVTAMVLSLSWICTCGLIKIITICLGCSFSWSIATAIWLLLYMLKTIFDNTIAMKK